MTRKYYNCRSQTKLWHKELAKKGKRARVRTRTLAERFGARAHSFGTLVRRANHLNYLGGPKSPPHTFFVLTNSRRFD